ncbi:MAG: hypothetical protein IJD92_04050 [Bacilli bacterium]|nr:hypothetical protein [Bacilli bacterium]
MKKLIKPLIVFIFGIFIGYYICNTNSIKNIFTNTYKAFQIGVYTNLDTANTYSSMYKDSIIIKDNELYRVYAAILKNQSNIENMSNYLTSKNIDFYLKEIEITNKETQKLINEYENLMTNNNEVVFLEINKMIINKYKESL